MPVGRGSSEVAAAEGCLVVVVEGLQVRLGAAGRVGGGEADLRLGKGLLSVGLLSVGGLLVARGLGILAGEVLRERVVFGDSEAAEVEVVVLKALAVTMVVGMWG